MGEFSKRIGDIGEEVVVDFLKLIGWNNPMKNEDIESIDKEFRKRTNGIDGYYHYISPMVSDTVENVLYSVKYSSAPYPGSQVTRQFKERYIELSKVIESFKKSELKQLTIRLREESDNYFDRGILFWLNNSGEGDIDLISKLQTVRLNSDIEHDGIFLVDNKRAEFIYDAISYSLLKFRDYNIDFLYFLNGLNHNERNIRSGKIMPIQYITTSVLPLRANKENETVVLLFSLDPLL